MTGAMPDKTARGVLFQRAVETNNFRIARLCLLFVWYYILHGEIFMRSLRFSLEMAPLTPTNALRLPSDTGGLHYLNAF